MTTLDDSCRAAQDVTPEGVPTRRGCGGSRGIWCRYLCQVAVLGLLLVSMTAAAPGVASADSSSATLTELSGEEMLLSVSVTFLGSKECGERCKWFGFAEVHPASIECPPGFTESSLGAWIGEVREAGTESGTAIANRYGHEGPLIVCVYVQEEKTHLVGEFGPFDPQPPPAPGPSPSPAPSPPPTGPPTTGSVPPSQSAPSSAPTPPTPLTRAQKLAKALKACNHKPKKRRAACRARARRLYGKKHH